MRKAVRYDGAAVTGLLTLIEQSEKPLVLPVDGTLECNAFFLFSAGYCHAIH